MSLDRLWAGWRSDYVSSITAQPTTAPALLDDPLSAEGATDDAASCVFCAILASQVPDDERQVVHVGEHSAVLLNAFPYASGHLLVMPIRHVATLDALDEAEAGELWTMTRRSLSAIERAYGPDGMNFGANIGRAAGAGIPRHVHLHVLPRWIGDTNFMTTVASVRVMPEALTETWRKLRAAWPI